MRSTEFVPLALVTSSAELAAQVALQPNPIARIAVLLFISMSISGPARGQITHTPPMLSTSTGYTSESVGIGPAGDDVLLVGTVFPFSISYSVNQQNPPYCTVVETYATSLALNENQPSAHTAATVAIPLQQITQNVSANCPTNGGLCTCNPPIISQAVHFNYLAAYQVYLNTLSPPDYTFQVQEIGSAGAIPPPTGVSNVVTLHVVKASPSMTLKGSLSSQSTTLVATLNVAYMPTGSVSFYYAGGAQIGIASVVDNNTGTGGTATLTTGPLHVGTDTVTALYSGDSDNQPASAGPITVVVPPPPTGFTPPALWVQQGGSFRAGEAQYADVNGDRKADLIFQGLDNRFWVSLSTGTGFTAPALWVQHGGSFEAGEAQYADVNGDGKADLIMQGLDNRFWVSLSTGTGFTPPALWVQQGGSFIAGQAQYADVNGDGKADLIFQGNDNSFWVSLSTGSGFTLPFLGIKQGGSFLAGEAHYADVDGDGKADLIFQGIDNRFWVSLSTIS